MAAASPKLVDEESDRLAVGFLVIKDESISERPG